jgi:Uma2 family endonuclease
MSMSQHPPKHVWDYSDYARFPDDGNRYEVIDGEVLVTPAPSTGHQHILANLVIALRQYVDRERIGIVLPDVDVLFVSGQFLRPDVVVVPTSFRAGVTNRGVEMPPALVIEIQSPTSSSIDRVKKPRRYGDFGIPEYWVVDPEERAVLIWRFARGAREAERSDEIVRWSPAGASTPFEITMDDLFKPMWG